MGRPKPLTPKASVTKTRTKRRYDEGGKIKTKPKK